MSRAVLLATLLSAAAPLAMAADSVPTAAPLAANVIVERNIAARGGLAAWQAVQTLSWAGKMDAGGNNEPPIQAPGRPAPKPIADPNAQTQLPFVLDMKRGRKTRLELQFNGQTAVQVYDGTRGWLVRPYLNRSGGEPYSAEQLRIAADDADLDGRLINYAAKGTKIEAEGVEPVEGKAAYKLKLTLGNGHIVHEWVDAQSFLEVRVEGTPRRLDKKIHPVVVFMRDYRNDGGLQIPHVLETQVAGVARTERILIDKVIVNPKLDDAIFTQPK